MKIKIKITEGQGCGDKSCPACYKNGHSGEEARMHRTTLAHLMADVKVLLSLIDDEDDLPEWLETKITKAGDYMSSAARYIAGNEAREHGQLEEQAQLDKEQILQALRNQGITSLEDISDDTLAMLVSTDQDTLEEKKSSRCTKTTKKASYCKR